MLLALQSYSHTDLSYGGEAVANFLGKIGAYFADAMFFTLGYASYLIIVLLLAYSLTLFIKQQKNANIYLGMRLAALLGLLVTSTSFAALLQLHMGESLLPKGPGGFMGLYFARLMYEYFNFSGATSALLIIELFGLSMIFGLSWLDLCEKIGFYACWPLRLWLSARPELAPEPPKSRIVRPSRSRAEIQQWQRQQDAAVAAARAAEVPQPVELSVADEAPVDKLAEQSELVTDSDAINRPVNAAFGVDDNLPLRRAFAADGDADPAAQEPQNTAPFFLQQRGGAWGKDWQQQPESIDASAQGQSPEDATPTGEAAQEFVALEAVTIKSKSAQAGADTLDIDQLAEDEASANPSKFTAVPLDLEPAASEANNARVAQAPVLAPARVPSSSKLFQLPSTELLNPSVVNGNTASSEYELSYLGHNLERRLGEYGIEAKVVSANPGPVVTRFELDLAAGVKVARVVNIAKDLARSLAVSSVRVVEIIPGKSHIGIEVPNKNRRMVRLREVLEAGVYQNSKDNLTLALGVDIEGKPVLTNLARMPHLLVAGTTGSGKSVGVNAMLLSLLYKATPEQVRLILIDPKMLELSVYNDIPHLLTEVIVDMNNAARGLRWCVMEMERRYLLMSKLGVRNLAGFNDKLRQSPEPIYDPLWDDQQAAPGESPTELKPLAQIVVVVDEYADLMMTVGKKVEELIARIAQKARAAGIHLILATQRPSVDVITGLIKANIPARIGFQVSSKIDSRTILDQGGGEQLLGHGDMLFLSGGTALPVRVHGAFVSDAEVHRVADFWRGQRRADDWLGAPLKLDSDDDLDNASPLSGQDNNEADAESDEPLYDAVVDFVIESQRVSISSVQRKFKIGYNRAARIIDAMEASGLVSPMETNGKREVLVESRG